MRLDKVSQQRAGVLPAVYWLEGSLANTLAIGSTISVKRTARAGPEEGEPERVECLGWYVSSPVVTLTENADGSVTCQTLNSHWRISLLAPESA